MANRARETLAFALLLGTLIAAFFHESLLRGKVLSPADVLLVSASFRDEGDVADYEPANRLLMDPVLQFQPWLEFNRAMLRTGQLPLWNPYAGCGAPHLANGQSAVFDPFHLLAYVGRLPEAYAWIAAGRLFVAGLGMFLLARSWGLRFWGRWYAGLVYPFTGFLVVWLLFPVTSVAVWMPWLFLAVDRVFAAPGGRSAATLAATTALVVFGGHIQTSAHVLLAAGVYAAWRWISQAIGEFDRGRVARAWAFGTALGLGLAAVQVIPLAVYLSRSPVWGERRREAVPWWSIARPRLLDAVCTALPYAYGSQRRGQPNLARALGVHNLNESAGGYAGLAALVWLAPLAWRVRRRSPRVAFLAALAGFGALGALALPPVDNLLRACPVLGVTDNRRLSLWVAFGLAMLGGIGLDHLGRTRRLGRRWIAAWLVVAAGLATVALVIPTIEPALRARATAHYRRSRADTDGGLAAARAERQVRATVEFLPRYYGLAATELVLLAALALAASGRRRGRSGVAPAVVALSLAEMFAFGMELNPAIDRDRHRPEPLVIARLRGWLGPGMRAIGVGEELPPNVLMRYGLADARNYDSVELESAVAWLDPVFEPSSASRSSRRDVTWASAAGALDRLRDSCVGAVVGSTPPPSGTFDRVERVGRAWIAWIDPAPWASVDSKTAEIGWRRRPGSAIVRVRLDAPDRLVIRETFAPGWVARLDGRPARIDPGPAPFGSLKLEPGEHTIEWSYQPHDVRIGLAISALAALVWILALTGIGRK